MSSTKLQSLSEIFTNRIFRIPDFQRGYSWQESQLEDFWEDLDNLHPDKSHYTGLLTVEPISEESIKNSEKWRDDLWLFKKGVSAYYIIDGQQRLTTIIVLLNEILRTLKEDEGINFGKKSEWVERFLYCTFENEYKSYVFGYEKDNPSDEYFKTKILEQHSSAADKYPETLYTRNLLTAKKFFSDRIKKLNKIHIEELFKKVVTCLKFNFYEIDNSLDVYVTFETMNNRGKKLSYLELLKNRMIYLSTLLPDNEEKKERLRTDINETWKTIYEYLGKNPKKPLGDDDFLFNHWIMYYEYDRSQSNVYADFLLKETFTAKNIINRVVAFDKIKEYISSLAECVKKWYYIHNIQDSNYSNNIKEYIQKLERLGMGAFPPMLMAVLTKESDEELIYRFLVACERFNFLVFAISHRPSNTQNSKLYRLARDYYKSDDKGLEAITEEITELTDKDEFSGWFDLERFQNHINELFTNDKEGFYSWGYLKYFLYEYELYLQSESDADTKVKWDDFNKRTKEDTIEHIYPQTATNPYWKKHFSKLGTNDRKVYLNSLGNLLLLSRKKNSTLQNDDFNKKKRHKNKDNKDVGYFNGSHSEIAVAQYKDWSPKNILNRGLLMLEFMEKRWGFSFDNWEIDKQSILLPMKTRKKR